MYGNTNVMRYSLVRRGLTDHSSQHAFNKGMTGVWQYRALAYRATGTFPQGIQGQAGS